MDEKTFSDGTKVVIDNGVVSIYSSGGNKLTCSNVDYYYSEEGYNCRNPEEVMNVYHSIFFFLNIFSD